MTKPILCLDLDGVIHRYSRGWQGEDVLYDPVTPGFFEWAARAHERFRLVVYSSRSKRQGGVIAMERWLLQQFIAWCKNADYSVYDMVEAEDDRVVKAFCRKTTGAHEVFIPLFTLSFAHEKPAAFLTIDDRCLQFRGDWSAWWLDPAWLAEFKPWNAEGCAPGPCEEPVAEGQVRLSKSGASVLYISDIENDCAVTSAILHGGETSEHGMPVAMIKTDYPIVVATLSMTTPPTTTQLRTPDANPWHPIDTAPKNEWVEVTGDSGVRAPPHFLALAKRDAAYRPLDHWRDVQLVSLSYQGWTPTHWRRASTFPEVRAVDGDVQ